MRRLLGAALLILLVYAISQAPGPWADTFTELGTNAGEGARGIGTFLTLLVT